MTVRISILVLALASVVAFSQESKVRKTAAPHTSAASGKEMYTAYCASCHGPSGKGDGPAAGSLKTSPTDLTMLKKQANGKFPSAHVYQVVKGDANTPAHGSKDMPVWGPVFLRLSSSHESEVHQRIDNLTHYIETLQQ
jgi:mono/diheme cytochrome c family protein